MTEERVAWSIITKERDMAFRLNIHHPRRRGDIEAGEEGRSK